VSVCECRRGKRHKLCETRANAVSPQPTDKLDNGVGQRRPIEGGSGGNGLDRMCSLLYDVLIECVLYIERVL
jgi:hypothetical protein